MSFPHVLIFLGTVITAIGALWASSQDQQRSEQQLELQREVLNGVNTLVAEGKITKEDARRIFIKVLPPESLNLQEKLDTKVIPAEKQNP